METNMEVSKFMVCPYRPPPSLPPHPKHRSATEEAEEGELLGTLARTKAPSPSSPGSPRRSVSQSRPRFPEGKQDLNRKGSAGVRNLRGAWLFVF